MADWSARLYHADCLDVMRSMEDASVDAVVTDPPYLIGFMGREFDEQGGAHRDPRRAQEWHETWAREALRVLKPGGHLLAFGGTRTYHRMAVAIEDAGFEVRDSLHYIYGSGFPKSLDVSKAIDKALGAERTEVVGHKDSGLDKGSGNSVDFGEANGRDETGLIPITLPATATATAWAGWHSALKPAHEPVTYATKHLTAVPLGATLNETCLLMESLLWWLAPAKFVESVSTSSRVERGADQSGSVRWLAAALSTAKSEPWSEMMATFKSQETALTYLSIALSWNALSDALLNLGSTSTTATGTDLTIALRTLNSSLSAITPEGITRAAWTQNGLWSNARDAAESLNASPLLWPSIPTPTVPASAWMQYGRVALSGLVTIAELLSPLLQVTDVATALSLAQTEPTMLSEELGSVHASAAASPLLRDDEQPGFVPCVVLDSNARTSAHEPVVLARKTFGGTVAENVMEHGTGALNIAATRIGTEGGTKSGPLNDNWRAAGTNERPSVVDIETLDDGRYPSNVLLAHLPECEGSGPAHTEVLCVAGCPVKELNEMSGESSSSSGLLTSKPGAIYGAGKGIYGFDDSGGAARFFYIAKPRKRERIGGHTRNLHPTVKPIDLMRYLVRLVTPLNGPDGPGVVLDPFAGSGSTGCAAMVEGFRFVGVEMEEESFETMVARVSDYAFVNGRAKPERCSVTPA